MDLSVIIPAYNEEKRIAVALEKTAAHLDARPWVTEVLVVDDGSQDATGERVLAVAAADPRIRLVKNGRNRGKGYSVRHGVQEARGRYIGFMDADYKTDIGGLDGALERLEAGWDGVIGDRSLEESQIAVPRRGYREAGSRLFKAVFLRLMGLQGLGDTQCGFKFFRAEVARRLFAEQRVDGFMFDVEILLIARRRGYRVCPLPVAWTFDADSRFNPLSGTLRNLSELARIRWRHRGRAAAEEER